MFDASSPDTIKRTPLALVALDQREMADEAGEHLAALGFRTDKVATQREAMQALKTKNYDLVVLPEAFAGGGVEDNQVLLDVIVWPADQRRFRFFALVGRNFDTMDEMQAFCYSMDMVFHIEDMPNFGAYLQMALGRKQESLAKFSEIDQVEEMA